MKKTLFTLAAAALLAGATPAAAAVNELFTFEFFAAGPTPIIGTDLNTHHTDFRHYNDYYVVDGYSDKTVACRETRVRDEDGNAVRRIRCHGLVPSWR